MKIRTKQRRMVLFGLYGLIISLLFFCTSCGNDGSGEETPDTLSLIDETTLIIESAGELSEYTEAGVLVLPEGYRKAAFTGDWELSELLVTEPVTLIFRAGVNVGNVRVELTGEPEDTDRYLIYTENAEQYRGITLESPYYEVTWEGEGVPGTEYCDRYYNISAINGEETDPLVGGAGTARLSGQKVRGYSLSADGNYAVLSGCGYNTFSSLSLTDYRFLRESDYKDGMAVTESDGNSYLLLKDEEGQVYGYRLLPDSSSYSLPVIYLTTEDEAEIESTEEYVAGTFRIDYNGCYEYENVLSAMEIRGRGFSSWKLDKKPYKLKLSSKESLFGLTAAKDWVLQANAADKSLMRNTVAMAAGSVLTNMVFVPHSYLVDVLLNGEYIGVYSLTEQVEIKEGRVPGTENSSAVDTDYLLEIGGLKTEFEWGSNIISSSLIHYTEIRNPDTDHLTEEQYKYIKSYVNDMDKTIAALGDYDAYLDIPSLIDWFLLDEFSYNVDSTFHRSGILLKKAGGKLYCAVPWDFDYAFGNMSWDSEDFNEWICLGNETTDTYKDGEKYIKENWMDYLLTDPSFISRLKSRWEEVGSSMYEAAMAEIDRLEEVAEVSANENFNRWTGYLGVKIQFEDKRSAEVDTWEGQLEYLRDFCTMRYNWMDEKIDELFRDYCE